MSMLPCHCCGNGVEEPKFDLSTPEGVKAFHEWRAEVDNHEGNSPIMCSDCTATFTKVIESKAKDEPKVIKQFRAIVERCAIGGVEDGDGKAVMVDLFSANAVVTVYDALNDKNKALLIERCGKSPYKMCKVAFKLLSKNKAA